MNYSIFKQYKSLHIILLLVLITLLSCKKDLDVASCSKPLTCPCEEIPPLNFTGFGYEYIYDSTLYQFGDFNPADPDVILVTDWKYDCTRKLNLRTGRNSILYQAIGVADWGKQDWILFTDVQKLYKIKANGDSLKLISGIGFVPSWNPDGTKYLYHNNLAGSGGVTVINNLHDEIIDTMSYNFGAENDWFEETRIVVNSGLFRFGDNSVNYIFKILPPGSPAWIGNEEFVFFQREGMFNINTQTQEVTKLRCFLNCQYYIAQKYIQQTNKIMATKVTKRLRSDGKSLYVSSDVVIMNPDGTNEEIIDVEAYLYE